MYTWQCRSFSELTPDELYELLKLRVNIFVVEQQCPYPELDDKDRIKETRHLMGYHQQQLVACSRLLPPGASYPSVSIGRVAIAQSARGQGLAYQLLEQALIHCAQHWPKQAIEIGAQTYLTDFYTQYGFIATSESYLEDGIAHVDMKRSADS
ncbi:GNAT family N-acetyltransferase [Vibrio cincinnatiensis]|uniref:GNAT family N-acetyltransferase n=1 Tax=Vibrio cincinnatiensis TaxID=675 RepID=UPI001EDE0F3E|nr:GNAT family N-acetyltransferase [Vibrio cincinnatiensis]MCG3766581.1 GNAT family N-acetyltransferase [Vibrio cincinnatiensis]